MRKGFTLIELLAVIVILAIIALIATPIILGIINDARIESNKRSIENYGKSIEQAIVRYQLTHNEVPAYLSQLTVEYDGAKVNCDTTKISEEGSVYLSGCSVGNSTSKIDYEYGKNPVICTLDGTEKDSSKYSAGDRYLCKVDPNKEAYGFYVLTTVDKSTEKTVNLIAEANIDLTTGEPIKDTNPTNKGLVAWQSSGDNVDGPTTAMDALKTATDSWTNLTEMTVDGWNSDASATNVGTFATPYRVKARLPYKQELSDYSSGTNNYLYNYLSGSGVSTNEVSGVDGYWTLSSITSYPNDAWNLDCSGYVYNNYVIIDEGFGLRPVITVSKNKLA